ncbi:MAG: hypothetical protein VX712_02680 [Bacteroidota bacterium]|nr:hypothetical protein [Bacteroidota bacterium]
MEKRFNREEELLGRLLKESGRQKPSAGFKMAILEQLQEKPVVKPYQSLIPKTAWIWIGLAFVFWGFGVYLLYADEPMKVAYDLKLPEWNITLPKLHFSQVMLYGIAFLSLFLLEIPFLKRWLVKQRSI